MVNAFRLRIYSPQDALVGLPLYVKYVDTTTGQGEIKPLTKELIDQGYQVTPLEIFNQCEDCFAWLDGGKTVIKYLYTKVKPEALSGFGEGEDEYTELRDVYAEALRIQNEEDYAKALAQVQQEREQSSKSKKWWTYGIIAAVVIVGIVLIWKRVKKNRRA